MHVISLSFHKKTYTEKSQKEFYHRYIKTMFEKNNQIRYCYKRPIKYFTLFEIRGVLNEI